MRVDENRLTATYLLARHGLTRLVWFQTSMLVSEARDREYEMKK